MRNIIKKAVGICVKTPQNRKIKKNQRHIINQSFEHNGMWVSYQKKLESLEEKKAVHTIVFMQAWSQKEIANFIPKEDLPANSCDVNPLETIWIIVHETTYKDPAPKTLDELRR